MFPFPIFWPFRKRVPDYERPFAAKYGIADAQIQKEQQLLAASRLGGAVRVTPEVLEELRAKAAAEIDRTRQPYLVAASDKGPIVSKIPTARPGDSEPQAYINKTRDILNKAMDKHTDELLALDRDIEKLTEERRQVRIAIDGMQAALTHMSAVDASVVPPTEADLDMMAGKVAAASLNDGAE